MFEGFQDFAVPVGGVHIHGVRGGSGPPLLLLHGYPQTHVMWHKVARPLAAHFTVIAADLRGYGNSSKPRSAADHSTYSKRAMGADMVGLMKTLGFNEFAILAHDRGARVGPPSRARLAGRSDAHGVARYRSNAGNVCSHGRGLRKGLLALVLSDPTRTSPRADDRGRPQSLLAQEVRERVRWTGTIRSSGSESIPLSVRAPGCDRGEL